MPIKAVEHWRTTKGRGAAGNPANRFDRVAVELDPGEAPTALASVYLPDHAQSVLTRNDSPDIGFDVSLNPYRGCEHGCVYCYARPSHEYLGLSAGLDFETRIFYKADAPALLEKELGKASWRPQTIACSGITDPYQPAERDFQITRGCLAVLARCRQPVSLITKSALVVRDLDLLRELAAHDAVRVTLSVTSLDPTLARRLEPRAASPRHRLEAVRAVADAGVPVGVNLAPIIPGLNDEEIPALAEAAAAAGAQWLGSTLLQLPHAVKDLFCDWLARHYPLRQNRVLDRLRDLRGGALNDPRFGHRMRGEGIWAETYSLLLARARARWKLARAWPPPSPAAFRPPGLQQTLFAL